MLRENIFPVVRLNPTSNSLKEAAPESKESKRFKIKSLGLGFGQGTWLGISQRNVGFEDSPYDWNRIMQAIDTDSYVKQAFLKYKDLFWKEGWDIVGENPEAVSYLYQRIDLFELAMNQPFEDFMTGVVDTLVKFANVFIVKSYGKLDPRFRVAGESNQSVIGFYTIPIETATIKRDRHNKPIKYRQSLVQGLNPAFAPELEDPTWDASEVIHLHLDRKDGYLWGTPFVVSALDDVIALRQIEQDVQNLIHRELYPMYVYTVGTETKPSTPEELDQAIAEIENMRVEGGLVVPERHSIGVVGSEGNALEIDNYLSHFKERVAIGLGVFPHHLGMATAGTNRSATDRLDTALYDRVKFIQSYIENCVRLYIFNEILIEGGFQPVTTPYNESTISDRCYLKFREIDIDTQIKKENHYLNLFNGDAVDWDELRALIGRSDAVDVQKLRSVITHMLQVSAQEELVKSQAKYGPSSAPASASPPGRVPAPKKPDAVASSTGGAPNLPNFKKDTGNKVAPSNQFGRKNSPNIRRDDILGFQESLLDELVNLIDNPEQGDINE